MSDSSTHPPAQGARLPCPIPYALELRIRAIAREARIRPLTLLDAFKHPQGAPLGPAGCARIVDILYRTGPPFLLEYALAMTALSVQPRDAKGHYLPREHPNRAEVYASGANSRARLREMDLYMRFNTSMPTRRRGRPEGS